ncbi:hypothetical protein GKZ90_0006080 [Flavobacterium sp. MC2016-06]|uniref:hypothetical protein n=1 Tax=Flavobacterium sp. MC2016-06 TaxID=2676308 RepID=UPI0012BAFC53|nr:hypothetical protein [Flavobacterium sp. MC2016-06]MBU3857706.1 hypothetical protein [Flavobacterium sp. MC2016-06]
MKLDLFKKIAEIDECNLHPKFKFLRDNPMLIGERNVLTNWTDGFIDRDNKIIKEFQTTFHSSFWEFYLFRVFKELDFEIDFTKDRPDFIINYPEKFFIEAVVSNIKKEGRDEETRNAEDVSSMIVPPHKQSDFHEVMDEAIVRNSNAILSKSEKYINKYINCDWVDSDKPFVIALSSFDQVNYGREHFYPMLALLYGHYFHPKLDDYESKESILKLGTNSSIPLGLFKDESYEHISAIIFSCTVTLGKLTSLSISNGESDVQLNGVINVRHDYEYPHYKPQVVTMDNPEYLSDSLFIFHNPLAKNKLNPEIFKNSNVIQVIPKNGQLSFEGENTPIYSRLNIYKAMINDYFVNLISEDFNT